MSKRGTALWVTSLILAALTSLWSYIFADPNFLLITHPAYVSFQRFMLGQQSNFWLRSPAFLLLILGWFVVYALWLRWLSHFSPRQKVLSWLSVVAVLLAGHNALSHDIFNYLFNAKMVMVYHANPHVKTALDFAQDPWVRFMHNVHTPAPYGWGWTALSLVPYLAGLGKFALSYLAMRVWMVLGLILTLSIVAQIEKKMTGEAVRFWQLAWNPLVLLEVCLMGHNDVWMMWPALLTVLLLLNWKPSVRSLKVFVTALLAFGLSIVQKYATVVLLPVLPLLIAWRWPAILERIVSVFRRFWPELATLALLAPLLTARSQQFHPWYLVWALCFFPVLRSRLLRCILIGLSVASLFRYIPWLENSLEYTPVVLALQKAITGTGAVAGLLMWWKTRKLYPRT